MRAVVITGPGGPDMLRIAMRPDPRPGPEEVVVALRATAVNRADILQRMGRYPAPPGVPEDIPGLEFAGEVESAGERVLGLAPGDRVMGIAAGGTYAERIAVHERMCLPIPPALGWEEAAAVPEAFLTAYDALVTRGRMAPGETVLLHAAGSGVGTAAVQIAAVAGARVVALSRSREKRSRLGDLGAHAVLDPETADLAEAIRRSAGSAGVDVVIELLGAATLGLDLDVLAPRGRIVLVGTITGSKVGVDLAVLMRKRATVIGTVLRGRPIEEKIAVVREFGRRMLPLLASGRLRPVVDRVLPLAEAASAHRALESNETFGKIVLQVP